MSLPGIGRGLWVAAAIPRRVLGKGASIPKRAPPQATGYRPCNPDATANPPKSSMLGRDQTPHQRRRHIRGLLSSAPQALPLRSHLTVPGPGAAGPLLRLDDVRRRMHSTRRSEFVHTQIGAQGGRAQSHFPPGHRVWRRAKGPARVFRARIGKEPPPGRQLSSGTESDPQHPRR
jgi:hypothetical protein